MYKLLLISMLLASCGKTVVQPSVSGVSASGEACKITSTSYGKIVTCGKDTVFVTNDVSGVQTTVKDQMQRACVEEISNYMADKSLVDMVGKSLDVNLKTILESDMGVYYIVSDSDYHPDPSDNVNANGQYKIEMITYYDSIPLSCGTIDIVTDEDTVFLGTNDEADGKITSYTFTLTLPQ